MTRSESGPDSERAGDATLPDDLRELLVRLAGTCQRVSLYPAGHPALESAAEEIAESLTDHIDDHGPLALTVAPDRILVGEAESDPGHPRISSLAELLHEHGLARVAFLPGLGRKELGDFLHRVSTMPREEGERLADLDDVETRWARIRAKPVRFERLGLAEEEPEEGRAEDDVGEERESRADRLWLGLARAVFSDEDEDPPDGTDLGPGALAAALEGRTRDTATVHEVARQLVAVGKKLAEGEFGVGEGDETPEEVEARLRARFSELFDALDPDTVRRLVRDGVVGEARIELLTYASGLLPPDALVGAVEAAVEAGELDTSPWMLRLMRKLGDHASTRDDRPASPDAVPAMQAQVREMLQGGVAPGSRPPGYAEALRGMTEKSGGLALAGGQQVDVEPTRVIQMALEVDVLGETGRGAAERLLEEGRLRALLEPLADAPEGSEVAEVLWVRLEAEECARRLLESDPPDFEMLEVVAERMGVVAAPPMLDRLAASESRSERRKLFSVLAGIGKSLAPVLVAALDPEGPWFVQRNLLALLVEIEARPIGFSALPWAEHEHPAVRREAYRYLLMDPETRDRAVRSALAEEDPKLVSLGLAAVEEEASPELESLVIRQVENAALSPEIRRLGVRAVAATGSERARQTLLGLCLRRRLWTFWREDLAPPDPVTVEALAALARGWPRDPEARRAIRMARESGKPEFREAVREGAP